MRKMRVCIVVFKFVIFQLQESDYLGVEIFYIYVGHVKKWGSSCLLKVKIFKKRDKTYEKIEIREILEVGE